MKATSVLGCALAGYCLFLLARTAQAQESPLGLYVGVGAGTATIRQDAEPDTDYFGLSREDIGWDAFVGVRPLPYLGAEIGYLDFGTVHSHGYYADGYSWGHASDNAPAGFAVGYLPVQPWWDFYLKAGAARLHRTWDFLPEPPCAFMSCNVAVSGVAPQFGSTTAWEFAWGIGTQWKFGPTAIRFEYVRVNTNNSANAGDPDLLSVGVSYTFF